MSLQLGHHLRAASSARGARLAQAAVARAGRFPTTEHSSGVRRPLLTPWCCPCHSRTSQVLPTAPAAAGHTTYTVGTCTPVPVPAEHRPTSPPRDTPTHESGGRASCVGNSDSSSSSSSSSAQTVAAVVGGSSSSGRRSRTARASSPRCGARLARHAALLLRMLLVLLLPPLAPRPALRLSVLKARSSWQWTAVSPRCAGFGSV
jgi:hypothetical protein